MKRPLILAGILLFALGVGGFYFYCALQEKIPSLSFSEEFPLGNPQITIRGLKEQRRYPDIRSLGANFTEIEWYQTINPESWEISSGMEKEELKKEISKAHERGLGVYLLPFLHLEGLPGAVGAYKAPDLDNFLSQLDILTLEWAAFAEENKVELFSPVNELQHWTGREEGRIGFQRASEWYQKILPKIREIYYGQLVTGYNSFSFDMIDQDPFEYEINQSGYDFVSFSVVPHVISDYNDYRRLVGRIIEVTEVWQEKFQTKGIIVTECGVPESSDSVTFYENNLSNGENYGQMRANLYDIFFSQTLGHFSGYFISDWAAGEASFYLKDSGQYHTFEQAHETEEVIKKYYLGQFSEQK